VGRDDEFEVTKSGRRRGTSRLLQVLCQQYIVLRPFRLTRVARPNDSKVPDIVSTPPRRPPAAIAAQRQSVGATGERQLSVAGVSHPPFLTDSIQLEADSAW
jgi:hypothetical protein